MRIAVPCEEGSVFQHFGHTEQFKLYETDGERVVESALIGTGGSGHSALARLLQERSVDTLICGGIGAGAVNALSAAGIRCVAGASGSADAAVAAFLAGTLVPANGATCSHSHTHHGGEHGCGEHDCGKNDCRG